MNKYQLNSLVERFQKERCELVYLEIYRKVHSLRDINKHALIKSGYGDDCDALGLFDDVFNRIINKSVTKCFVGLLSKSLKNARTDFIRKEKKRRDRLLSLDSLITDEDDAPTSNSILSTGYDTTEHEGMQKKKKAEQLALINFLLRPLRTDTIAILVAMNRHRYDSDYALSKALGLHHSTVSRKLSAMAKNYDESKFGEPRDNYAV